MIKAKCPQGHPAGRFPVADEPASRKRHTPRIMGVNPMSAFVVGHDHIDALVTFAIDKRLSFVMPGRQLRITITEHVATEIGALLLVENERSVGHRYQTNDSTRMPGTIGEDNTNYRFRRWRQPLPALAILRACDCLEYQSCEHDAWKASTAHEILITIRDAAINALPGYTDQPWEMCRARLSVVASS